MERTDTEVRKVRFFFEELVPRKAERAIGYIIFPLDLIPDITPLVGYTDDLASVASIVAGVAAYTNFSLEELDKYIDSLENK